LWGYAIVAAVLAGDYGIDVPNGDEFHVHTDAPNVPAIYQMIDAGIERFTIRSAGLNHFAWMLDIRDRETGEDLRPLFHERYLHSMRRSFEPMTREMLAIFGLCPSAGDTHMVEYLAWTHDPVSRPWEKYDLKLQSWEGNLERRRRVRARAEAIASGTESVDDLRAVRSEGAVEIVEARLLGQPVRMPALNIANHDCCLPGLPEWAVVEIPATVSSKGICGEAVEALPPAITELCRRESHLASLVVDAAVSGDRELALQALLMDPMANDIDRTRAILDDFLVSFREWLPQFWDGRQ
jgi:alpha-galactosidase